MFATKWMSVPGLIGILMSLLGRAVPSRCGLGASIVGEAGVIVLRPDYVYVPVTSMCPHPNDRESIFVLLRIAGYC